MASPLRTLPHRREAEAAILGGVLLRGLDALDDVLAHVGVDDFHVPAYQAAFRAMCMLAERGAVLDVVTLEAQLRRTGELELVGGIEGLARLDRHATAHNITAHAELVAEVARRRRVIVACREAAEQGMGEVEDDDAYVDAVAVAVEAATQRRSDAGPRKAAGMVKGVVETIVARQQLGAAVTGIPTGFAQLDELTAGYQPKDLIILAARPSMGKTAFALNLAAHLALPRQAHLVLPEHERPPLVPVLFFSLEMGAAQLVERVMNAEARVDAKRVRTGRRLLESEFRALLVAADRIHQGVLEIDESASLAVTEIRARARRWKRAHFGSETGQGIVMVDYLQLVRGGKPRYDSREQEVADITRGFKALAKELGMPVLALAQLNRGVAHRADHRPQLADLRESGAIEQDADVVLFVHREEMYLAHDAPESERAEHANKAEIILGKQRNGELGVVHLHYIAAQTRFAEPAPELLR